MSAKKPVVKQKLPVYPYQNRSLESVDGEKWKPVTAYEEYYQVSGYGRIKSLGQYIEFLIPGKHIVSYWKPEKILAQGIRRRWNSISKEYIYYLTVTLCVDQKSKTISVHRLVWNAFVNKLNFRKDKLNIIHKNGEGRNNHYKNLTTGNRSEVGRNTYWQGRGIRLADYVDESVFAKRARSRRKPVTQYDLQGNRIKTYLSVTDAEKKTGVGRSNIALAAKQIKAQMGGFIWKYGKGDKKTDISFYLNAKRVFKEIFGKPVTQYDLEGNRVQVYATINDAARAAGSSRSSISNAVSGKYMTAKGFIWREGEGRKKIDISFYIKRKKQFSKKSSKKIIQHSLRDKIIKVYPSIKEAALAMQCNPETISRAAHGKLKTAKRYKWKFVK